MIKFKNWKDDILDLEVHAVKYLAGGQFAIVLFDPVEEEDYDVVTRNIPEAHGFLKPNQTLIPDHSDSEDLVQTLVEEGVLTPTDIQFPYNFYTMRAYDICLEKVDRIE